MARTPRRDRNNDFSKDIAEEIYMAMSTMDYGNNLSVTPLAKPVQSPIVEYPLCDESWIALKDKSDSEWNETVRSRVLFVIVDLHTENALNPTYKQCSICKDSLFIPKITMCGHIFCLPCVFSYTNACGKRNSFKCPICSRIVHIQDLKSVIWRVVDRPKVGDELWFYLYRYNTEEGTIEKMKNTSCDTPARRSRKKKSSRMAKHTFEHLWSLVEHMGNGQLHINQYSNPSLLTLPNNDIYWVAPESANLSMYDLERTLLVGRLENTDTEEYEIPILVDCTEHLDTMQELLNREIVALMAVNYDEDNSSVTKKYNPEARGERAYINTGPLDQLMHRSKPHFPRTGYHSNKNNESGAKETSQHRFKKYIYYYKSECYFNVFLCNSNCKQIADQVMNDENNQCDPSLNNTKLKLPTVVTGTLQRVNNYESQNINAIDPFWKRCSSNLKFLSFCVIQVHTPYQLETPITELYPVEPTYRQELSPKIREACVSNSNAHQEEENEQNQSSFTQDFYDPLSYQALYENNIGNTLQDVYPDIQSHHYDVFGNKWDDFPSFDSN